MSEINILIVDDSMLARKMLTSAVASSLPNATIVEAANGQEAVDIMEKSSIDVMFIDYNMPVMNGLEAVDIIRANNKQTAIALCTANVQDAIKTRAAKYDVQLIGKPITPDKVKDFVMTYGRADG